MKKLINRIRLKLCFNLSCKIEELFPEGYEPRVDIAPCYKDRDKDLVVIAFKVPHSVTKKLMWYFKAWKKEA